MVGLFLLMCAALGTLLFNRRGSCIIILLIMLLFSALLLWYVATDSLQTNW